MTSPALPAPGVRHGIGGVVAMLALAVALRAPIATVPPVVADLQRDLGVSASAVALLTSIPVLCFGLVTPGSSSLLRRLGLRTSGVLCLTGIAAGSLLRSTGSFAAALAGTVLIGAAIAIGNLVIPVLIGRYWAPRAAGLMGSYTATMNVGATAATATTATLALTYGWQLATGVWGVVLGGVGVALWLAFSPREARPVASAAPLGPAPASPAPPSAVVPMWRNLAAWLLAASFACQSMTFYTVTTWLPTALRDSLDLDAVSAGWGASGFQVAGILGPLLVPLFIRVVRPSNVVLVLVVAAFWAALPLGMLLVPQWWGVWVLCGGLAQGGYFALVFLLIVRRTRTTDENRRMAAHVQTVGYCVAATGPVIMGWLHERWPSWDLLFVVVAGLVAAMTVTGVLATRVPLPPVAQDEPAT